MIPTAAITLAANQRKKEKAYWLNQLSGHPVKDSFPCDIEIETPGTVSYRLESVGFSLPVEVSQPLIELSKGSNERTFIILLAGIFVLLRKYTGTRDIIIGIPVSRPAANVDFINHALAIRLSIEDNHSFRLLLSKIRETLIQATAHQNFPCEVLPGLLNLAWQEEEEFPLFDVGVSLKNIHPKNLEEFTPNIMVSFEQAENEIKVQFIYNAGRYRRSSINRLTGHFRELMSQALSGPEQKIAALELLTAEEKEQILIAFNDTAAEFPEAFTVHELIDRQAGQTPEAAAVVYKSQWLSYAELKKRSDCLAGELNRRGLGPGHIAAVIMGHTPEMIASLIGILKSGAAYLPIDPEYPQERIDYILKDSNARVLINKSEILNSKSRVQTNPNDQNTNIPNKIRASNSLPTNLAYIIYTSGSTGKPKGVMIDHRSFIDFTTWAVVEFEHRPGYQVLLSNSYASDGSIQQIFPPLISGGTLHLIDKELRLDVVGYLDYLKKNKINNIDEVPVLMKELVALFDDNDNEEKLPALTCLSLGSENVPIDLVKKCRKHLNHQGKIINAYGPAEASVETTTYHCNGLADDEESLIGKPRRNIRVYILDDLGHLCAVGVRGEICISGVGLARGYLNRPELTAEKFRPLMPLITQMTQIKNKNSTLRAEFHHSAFSIQHSNLYCTGDRGQWLPDGNIRFLGRIDDQIKIRGYRVELQEIENVLKSHHAIKNAVVLTRENTAGENEICAYYVSKTEPNPSLREYLEKRLPSYMLPGHLIELEKIPLTPNGKVDKKALPKLGAGQTGQPGEFVPPRDELEKQLVDAWAEVLELSPETIGIHTDFFKIGGHSLKAAVLAARIRKRLQVEMPVIQLFKTPTIAGLSQFLKTSGKNDEASIEPVELKEYYDLTPVQKRLYILQQMDPGSAVYNVPAFITLEKAIDKEKLTGIFKKIIQRHEILRTSYQMIHSEPRQKIHDQVEFEIEYLVDKQAQTRDLCAFDLSRAPLLRVKLIKEETGKIILAVDMHHIICDPISHEVLANEFAALCNGEELPELKIQYKDYAGWQNSAAQKAKIKQQENYWLQLLSGDLPVLELPIDFSRPQIQGFEGASVDFMFGREETHDLKNKIKYLNVTTFMFLLAAFNILLAKVSGQEDIIIGTPISTRQHQDIEKMIGMFINTLALRNDPADCKTFDGFLQDLKITTLAAYDNSDYPFEELVEKIAVQRDTGRNPIFDAMFNHLYVPGVLPGPNEEEKIMLNRHQKTTAKFDLTLTATEYDNHIFFNIEYCTGLFKSETIDHIVYYFIKILKSVTEDPGKQIAFIEIISQEEKKLLLFDFNNTAADFPRNKTIHQLFTEQAAQTPNAIALVAVVACETREKHEKHITYFQLNEQSGRVAGLLIEKGVLPDNIVAVMMERSVEMIIGIFGILKSGGAYLPIDPGYPQERIDYMLKDSNAKVLIINKPEIRNPKSETNPNDQNKNQNFGAASVLNLDHLDFEFVSNFDIRASNLLSSNLAYVIYTSGSTGKPKGVMIENRSVVNFIKGITDVIPFQSHDRILSLTTISFDIFGLETLLPFTRGSAVIMGSSEAQQDVFLGLRIIEREAITIFQATPSRLQLFIQDKAAGKSLMKLKYLIIGGEALPRQLLELLKEQTTARIYNVYGPTETTIWSTIKEVSGDLALNIGKPLANTYIYILSHFGTLQPVGIPGECCIGGDGVARGYLNNPEQTAEKFDNKYRSYRTNRTYIHYQTGDLARWLPDGNIEFLGRLDHQVKIRGFRIELGEIENRLAKYPGVKEAVAAIAVHKEDIGDKYICAYIVSEQDYDEARIREFLLKELPEYMIPAYFVRLEQIPLTPTGKLDRRALPEPKIKAGQDYIAPRNKTETRLVELWAEVLNIPPNMISIDANFFQLGGHSLKATVLASRIHKEMNVKLPLMEFFKAPTIRGLSEYTRGTAADIYETIMPAEEKEYYVLSFSQEQMYILQQLNLHSTAYNMPEIILLNEEIDINKLEESFITLINRHDSLRTSFHILHDVPIQKIHDEVSFEIESFATDANGVHGQTRTLTEVLGGPGTLFQKGSWPPGAIIKSFIRPFDLSHAPLLRVGLAKTGAGKYILMVDMHHIIADGISCRILRDEFMALQDGKELPPLRIQYKDFSQWQNSPKEIEKLHRQMLFWVKEFEGEIPILKIPLDYPRPLTPDFEGDFIDFEIPAGETRDLNSLALQNSGTLFMILTATFNILLAKLSGQEEIIIGAPIAGRRHPDLEKIIGIFVNPLALRNYPAGERTFKEFLNDVKERVLAAFENQEYPFESLVDKLALPRNMGHNPLFDVLLVLQNMDKVSDGPGKESEFVTSQPVQAVKFDLTLTVMERNNGLFLSLQYRTKLFKKETTERFISYFRKIITVVMKEPGIRLNKIEIISEEEKKQVLNDFNRSNAIYPEDKTLHQLFEEQVERTPDLISIVGHIANAFDKVHVSFRELNNRSNHTANRLRAKGLKRGSIVGIMVDPIPGMVVGIMGILKAGSVFLPIGPESPVERINFSLNDSSVSIILTQPHLADTFEKRFEIINLEDNALYTGECPNVISDALTTKPLYVIYTSGTTGRPKGVLIAHKNIVNYVYWFVQTIGLTAADRAILTSSFAFDMFYTLFFSFLTAGLQLHLIPRETFLFPGRLLTYLVKNKITYMKLTPSLFNLIAGSPEFSPGILKDLRFIMLGGEEINVNDVEKAHQLYPHLRIMNHYGPTETTIGSIARFLDFNKFEAYKIAPTIGKPIYNTRVYILDKGFNIVPTGVVGGLFIGGDGVGMGYLNRPGLTSERFKRFYRSYMSHKTYILYHTGDLARWHDDGNIEFLGRADDQVKIRGYRIELGEIERQLSLYPGIKEVVLAVQQEDNGGKYICAYMVSKNEISFPGLRKYLAARLPDYMIPSYFVKLEEIPLTVHGKVNRSALPEPRENCLKDNAAYIPPQNAIEKQLVEIWEKVLGRTNIGINENFFQVGGDSIKAIQVISRLNSAGYKLEMRDLFQYPLISELTPYLKKTERIPDQSVITGSFPLTPIQEAFFAKACGALHHYNQAVMFYSREGFARKTLEIVFTRVQEHHDALRVTYRKDPVSGQIIQTNHGLNYPLSLQEYNLKNHENCPAELNTKVNEIQAGIDLENGPLMKLGLFHLDDGDRLLIVIHHLVIDGISWRILFEDIETLVGQYQRGERLLLPPKTDSFKLWSEKLSLYAESKTLLQEKNYWLQLENQFLTPIPYDFESRENLLKDTHNISFNLGEEETGLLLTKVNNAFRTEINDILLTALGLAVKKTFDRERLFIALEGHGREDIGADIDTGRTVGWFTSVFPVLLDLTYAGNTGRQLKEIKETLRKIPNKGIGYGILKYLTTAENKKDISFKLKPQIRFNYLGQFGSDVKRLTFCEIAAESAGITQDLNIPAEYDIDIVGIIANNQLEINLSYNEKRFKTGTIELLTRHFKSGLVHLIGYCSAGENTEFSPADFTYKGLTIDKVDQLIKEYPNLEDIYTLSPMQEGMLFHALVDQSFNSYFEQISYRLQGELDISRVEKSFNEVLKRHDILRTAFVYKDVERPVQVVLKERVIDFYYEDIRNIDNEEEKRFFINKYKEKDKQRRFDLSKEPLIRAAVFRLAELEYEFTWSHHHILMDGWCTGILIKEFLEIYHSHFGLEQGTHHLPKVKPYRTYIQWLEKRDKEESSRYWHNYLESYEEPAAIPGKINLDRGASGELNLYLEKNESLTLNSETTAALTKLAAQNRVTVNTLLQVVWGVLLGKYNGKEDVVFGAVVSGRPYELEGVETMVGLFINTVPVRIRFNPGQPFNGLIQAMQREFMAGEPYHYHPLAEIQSGSLLKQNLIDHLFIFENYPLVEQIEGYGGSKGNTGKPSTLTIKNVEVFEQTNYDFNIIISAAGQINITMQYNSQVIDSVYIKRVLGHFQLAIDRVIADDALEVLELTLPSDEEMQRILNEFNATGAEYPKDKTIHQLFAEQVDKSPDHIAVFGHGHASTTRTNTDNVGADLCVCPNFLHQITYRQLNEQSDRLAGLLIEKGVLPDNIVALMMERSVEMIIGIFGILKAGGAYLPIDPEYPQERIDYMLKDSNAKLIINFEFFKEVPQAPFLQHSSFSIQHSNHLAYIIYTSGTTGRPKGVMVQQRSVINRLNWMQKAYPINENDVLIQKTPITFDVSVWELFWWSFQGAALVLPDPGVEKKPGELIQVMKVHRVTTIHFVPSMLNVWLDYINNAVQKELLSLRYIFSSGEALESYQVNKFYSHFGENSCVKLINLYGPTEACVDVSNYNCVFSDGYTFKNIPIGKPIDNIHLYIVDKEFTLQPIGIAGELLIGGVGLARGYLNRPELTAEKFDQDLWDEKDDQDKCGVLRTKILHSNLYRTGDLARWLNDGNIEFLGRIDNQVKIRGFRIELQEIESQLMAHPWVSEAVVVPHQNKKEKGDSQDKILCAYIVLNITGKQYLTSAGNEIKNHLLNVLPTYMVPPYIIFLENMPLTRNGKIDHKALPEPGGIEAGKEKEYLAPRNEVEKGIVFIVADILGIDHNKISVRANFFDIGFNSITILKLVHRISEEFRIDFPIGALFAGPNVEGIAEGMKKGYTPFASRNAVLLNRKKASQNLFLISGDGRTYIFKELAMLLEGRFNVYIIQGKGIMDTGPLPETRQEIYEYFLHEIKLVQPDGPYLLGGHCYGAMIAYELARILEERKNKVSGLILFDEPALMPDIIVDHLVMLRWYNKFRRAGEKLRKIAKTIKSKLNPGEHTNKQKTIGINPVMPEDLEARRLEIIANYARLYPDQLHYTRIVKAPVLLFKAAWWAQKHPHPRWAPGTVARMSQTNVTLVDTPGGHISMFEAPHVSVLAQRLIEKIEDRQTIKL